MSTPLVNDAEVRALIQLSAGTDTSVFISAAHLIIDEDLAPVTNQLSGSRIKLIEQYLAAHFAAVSAERGGLSSDAIGGDTSETYNNPGYKPGLAATRFGQQAIVLDTTGTLSALAESSSGQKQALFRVAGTKFCGYNAIGRTS